MATLRLALLLSLAAFAIAGSLRPGASVFGADLRLTAELPERALLGMPLRAAVRLTNNGPAPVRIDRLGSGYTIHTSVRTPAGERKLYQGVCGNGMREPDLSSLRPGDSVVEQIDITRMMPIPEPAGDPLGPAGDWRLTFTYQPRPPRAGTIPFALPSLTASATVQITAIPDPTHEIELGRRARTRPHITTSSAFKPRAAAMVELLRNHHESPVLALALHPWLDDACRQEEWSALRQAGLAALGAPSSGLELQRYGITMLARSAAGRGDWQSLELWLPLADAGERFRLRRCLNERRAWNHPANP